MLRYYEIVSVFLQETILNWKIKVARKLIWNQKFHRCLSHFRTFHIEIMLRCYEIVSVFLQEETILNWKIKVARKLIWNQKFHRCLHILEHFVVEIMLRCYEIVSVFLQEETILNWKIKVARKLIWNQKLNIFALDSTVEKVSQMLAHFRTFCCWNNAEMLRNRFSIFTRRNDFELKN